MRPAPVVDRDHLAVVRRVLVRADPEHAAERAAEPDHESAGQARRGGGARESRPRSVLALIPPACRLVPPRGREHPGRAQHAHGLDARPRPARLAPGPRARGGLWLVGPPLLGGRRVRWLTGCVVSWLAWSDVR